MLGFAMDCFMGGLGVLLFILCIQDVIRLRITRIADVGWFALVSGATIGLALYLISHFIVGFFVMWSMYD